MSGDERVLKAPEAEVPLGRALVAEALGTFLLTLASVGAIQLARLGLIPELAAAVITPGLVVTGMIYALGDVSGAHINPVVTLAFALRGDFAWRRVVPYLAVQFGAAVLAGGVARAVAPLPHATERISSSGAFLLDASATAVLLVVILATAHRNAKIRPTVGMAVGLTVVLDHFMTNTVSGVSMNPARVFGPALVDGAVPDAWPHLGGPLLGSVAGVALTWLMRGPLNHSEAEAAVGTGGRG
ncbi:MIP/aquaporin family protein [Deinococcus sonorensis]|uniref:MIP/aquaporin family protein n=2 Tax=Deinococcus sonorensis TaxID=309891 RepID=A0AAU7UA57_9DEIO